MSLFDTGIRPAIDAYLAKKAAEERDYGDYWSASSAGYCMRLNIMRRLGIPKVPELEDNATQTRIFEAGHIFHEWMQRITKDAGLSIAQELELQDEDLMVRGHFDDLVLITPYKTLDPSKVEPFELDGEVLKPVLAEEIGSQHLILYDYKTAHSAAFKFKKQQKETGHYHTMQLGTYMYEIRKLQKLPVKPEWLDSLPLLEESRIMTISKDDLRLHEVELLWSPQLEKKVVEYWKTLNGYWKAKKLPKCTCLDYDGGFLGRRSAKGKIYNDYFWDEQPCSLEWAKKHKDKLEGWVYEQ